MRPHDLDILSLVVGIAFSGIGLVFLIDPDTGLTGRWIWPALLILMGVAGLLASRRGGRSDAGADSHATVDSD